MVKVDLDIKGVLGLLEIGSLSKDKVAKMLDEFNKDQLIDYLVSNFVESSADSDMELSNPDELD
jgi:hypothetical protein